MRNPVILATILDIVEKHAAEGGEEMRAVSAATIRELLRDEHGIVVKTKTIISVMMEVREEESPVENEMLMD